VFLLTLSVRPCSRMSTAARK